MKDPLQLKHTPYEILGIEKTADKAAIMAAFKKGVMARRNVQELTAAHKALLEPVERAFVDIFLYDESFVKQLVPVVCNNNSQLVSRRMDIAKSWGNLHKKSFPYMPASHSLAVLWYWWAYYYEEKQLAKLSKITFDEVEQIPDTPSPDDLWANVISYWVFLINSDEFLDIWPGAKNVKDDGEVKLRERLESHFVHFFHNFKERYQNNGDTSSVKRIQKYELLFSTEIRIAKELSKYNLRIKTGEKSFVVCCGKMMLQDVDQLDDTIKQVSNLKDSAEQDSEQHNKICLILSLLSPFTHIFVLMEDRKFDEVIKEIEALPAEQQTIKELRQLLAIAYLAKGKQQFSVDLYDEAFTYWRKAVDVGENREEINNTIASSCKSEAVSLQKSDTDTAIKIFEKGIALTNDIKLKEELSVILCQRGINKILKAQKVLEEKPNDVNAKEDIKTGVEDIRRAVELDPSNSYASEQLKHAEEILLGQECWFCKGEKNPSDKSAAVEVMMHKETERTSSQVKWQILPVNVPRCRSCKKIHDFGGAKLAVGGVVGGFIGLIIGLTIWWFIGLVGKDHRVAESLIAALNKNSQEAAVMLGVVGKPAVEPLIATLKDSDKDVRKDAAWALGRIKDRSAVEPLIAALKDNDWDVRMDTAWALGEIKDPRAVEPLITALKDSNRDVRKYAAWALGEIKDPRAIKPIIAALKESGDKNVLASLAKTKTTSDFTSTEEAVTQSKGAQHAALTALRAKQVTYDKDNIAVTTSIKIKDDVATVMYGSYGVEKSKTNPSSMKESVEKAERTSGKVVFPVVDVLIVSRELIYAKEGEDAYSSKPESAGYMVTVDANGNLITISSEGAGPAFEDKDLVGRIQKVLKEKAIEGRDGFRKGAVLVLTQEAMSEGEKNVLKVLGQLMDQIARQEGKKRSEINIMVFAKEMPFGAFKKNGTYDTSSFLESVASGKLEKAEYLPVYSTHAGKVTKVVETPSGIMITIAIQEEGTGEVLHVFTGVIATGVRKGDTIPAGKLIGLAIASDGSNPSSVGFKAVATDEKVKDVGKSATVNRESEEKDSQHEPKIGGLPKNDLSKLNKKKGETEVEFMRRFFEAVSREKMDKEVRRDVARTLGKIGRPQKGAWWFLGMVIGGVMGLAIGRRLKGDAKSLEIRLDAPIIKQAQVEGWVLGEKPPGVQ